MRPQGQNASACIALQKQVSATSAAILDRRPDACYQVPRAGLYGFGPNKMPVQSIPGGKRDEDTPDNPIERTPGDFANE